MLAASRSVGGSDVHSVKHFVGLMLAPLLVERAACTGGMSIDLGIGAIADLKGCLAAIGIPSVIMTTGVI